MHAVVIRGTFNDRAGAEAELPDLVSQVSAMLGSVAGYWVATSADQGTSIVVFESEDGAQALASMARDAPAGAVITGSVEFGEVLAHA
jgi:hypothetical protein